jgi:pimeloyl-ACP methyl ester carboxylesterase
MAPEVDRVDVHGQSLAYRRAGHGPPIVLLHGAYEDSRIWRRQIDGLSDEFTVLAWDAPGCGLSSDPPDTFAAADYADCLAGLIDALGLAPAHVLGVSWGSIWALGLYERHPEAVASLVLTAAYAGWAGSLPPDEVQRRLRQVLREVELPAEAFIGDWMPTLLTAAAELDLRAEVAAIMADFHPAGTRVAARIMAELDYRPVLPTIAVPTLLLYGEADVRSPVDVGEDLQARIPGSTLVVLPGAPHLASVETPQLFNDAVRAFLRAPPPAP